MDIAHSATAQADVQANSEQGRSKPRILVFCNKVKTVRFVHTLCVEAGFRAVMLHGERSQPEREVCLPLLARSPSPFRGETNMEILHNLTSAGRHTIETGGQGYHLFT